MSGLRLWLKVFVLRLLVAIDSLLHLIVCTMSRLASFLSMGLTKEH